MKFSLSIIIFLTLTISLQAKQFNIIFRYDDVRLQNNATNEKIVRIFLHHHIPLVLGVIPYDANEQPVVNNKSTFLSLLKRAASKRQIEIALHGLTHQRITSYGEFAGLSFEEQYRRIYLGKHLLDSVFSCSLKTFIPPWNAHDNNTIKALNYNGISIVSSSNYDIWHGATYYPMTTSDFREIVSLVLHNQLFGGVGVVMMHGYDFTDNQSFEELDKILSQLQQNSSVYFYTFYELKQKGIVINTIQSEELIHQNLLCKLIHHKGIFISTQDIILIKLINALLYLLLFYLTYWIAKLALLRTHCHNSIQTIALMFGGLLILCSVWFYWWGPVKLIFCTILFAWILTYCFRLFKIYNIELSVALIKRKC